MSGYGEGPWTIEYDNDVGERDEFFVEWFDVGPARLLFDTRMGERDQAHRIACIIGASRDLLAACKEAANVLAGCVAPLGGCDDERHMKDALAALEAAIAKAEQP